MKSKCFFLYKYSSSFQSNKELNTTSKDQITYSSSEETKVDVPFDPEFLKEIWFEINQNFGATILGYDFIIPKNDQSSL